jgi:hypothetical protein
VHIEKKVDAPASDYLSASMFESLLQTAWDVIRGGSSKEATATLKTLDKEI